MAVLDNFGSKVKQNIKWTRDDHFYLSFTTTNADGTAVDLTGTTPRGEIRDQTTGLLIVAFTAGFVGGDVTSGHVFFSLTGPQVDALPDEADYDWELDGGDSNRRTLVFGTFKVVDDVTRDGTP